MCVYVYVYVCVMYIIYRYIWCAYVYVCIYIYMYIYIYDVYVYVYIYIYVCTCICTLTLAFGNPWLEGCVLLVFVECLLSSSFQPRYEYRQCTSTHQLLMDCRYIPTSPGCSSWPSCIVCIHYVYYGCKKGARKTAPRTRTILPTSLIECVIVCSYVFLILPLLSAEICSWGVKSAFCSANPGSCGVCQVSPSTCTSMELSGRSSTPIANGEVQATSILLPTTFSLRTSVPGELQWQ